MINIELNESKIKLKGANTRLLFHTLQLQLKR